MKPISLAKNLTHENRRRRPNLSLARELNFPHWRVRLRAWLNEFVSGGSHFVRLVGPNSRPLEHHEFQRLELCLANRVL